MRAPALANQSTNHFQLNPNLYNCSFYLFIWGDLAFSYLETKKQSVIPLLCNSDKKYLIVSTSPIEIASLWF